MGKILKDFSARQVLQDEAGRIGYVLPRERRRDVSIQNTVNLEITSIDLGEACIEGTE